MIEFWTFQFALIIIIHKVHTQTDHTHTYTHTHNASKRKHINFDQSIYKWIAIIKSQA